MWNIHSRAHQKISYGMRPCVEFLFHNSRKISYKNDFTEVVNLNVIEFYKLASKSRKMANIASLSNFLIEIKYDVAGSIWFSTKRRFCSIQCSEGQSWSICSQAPVFTRRETSRPFSVSLTIQHEKYGFFIYICRTSFQTLLSEDKKSTISAIMHSWSSFDRIHLMPWHCNQNFYLGYKTFLHEAANIMASFVHLLTLRLTKTSKPDVLFELLEGFAKF